MIRDFYDKNQKTHDRVSKMNSKIFIDEIFDVAKVYICNTSTWVVKRLYSFQNLTNMIFAMAVRDHIIRKSSKFRFLACERLTTVDFLTN